MNEPFIQPELKDQVGWRLNERDKQNLRVLMFMSRQSNVSQLLRDLVEVHAEQAREGFVRAVERMTELEDQTK